MTPTAQIILEFNSKGEVASVRAAKSVGDAIDGVSHAAKNVKKSLDDADQSVLNLSKRSKEAAKDVKERLQSWAAQILVLVGVYKALDSAMSLVQRGVKQNSEWEQSKIGIASVLASVREIRDEQGNLVTGAEAYQVALGLAEEAMSRIKIMGLETTATSQDLVAGFQQLIGPAAAAGLTMKQTLDFTMSMVQSLGAIGIPFNQLSAEARSLLDGTIVPTQDRLAVTLGITGDMVKNWKQQGVLAQMLLEKMSAFAAAGDDVAKTWGGVTSNLQDAIDTVAMDASKGLYANLKTSLIEIQDLLVTTKGATPGVSNDFKNIADYIERVQTAIGDSLLETTREFVEYIRELNDPENLAELEQTLKDIWGAAKTALGTMRNIGAVIGDVGKSAVSAWQALPEPVREWGLIAAILGGKRGLAGLAAVMALTESAANIVKGFSALSEGKLSFGAFATMNGAELDAWLKKNGYGTGLNSLIGKDQGEHRPSLASSHSGYRPSLAPSHGGQPKGSLGEGRGGGGSSGKGASKIASAREQLQKIREEIAALNGEATKSSNSLEQKEREIERLGKAAGLSANDIDKLKTQYGDAFKTNALQGFNKQIAQLEGNTKALRDIQLDEEVKKWSASFNELVSKGKMTTGEAAENIERLKTAISKSVEVKDAQASLSFIKEYSQLSGDFSQNQKILLEMLEREAEVHRATLPASLQPYIDKWQELKKLQEARDPLSGSIRGLRSYSNEAMNLAKGIEGAWTSGFQGMEDALVKFTMSGKLSFSDMANSIISDLMRIAVRSSITGPLTSGLGDIFSGMFSGSSSPLPVIGGPSGGGVVPAYIHHAGGRVDGSGPTRTVSAYDYLHAPRFHSGGGFFKRDEYPAILQYGERVLNRQETAAYNAREWAGRDVMGRSGAAAQATPQVFVSIQNNTGAEVSQETRTDNMGRKNIRVIIGDAAASQMVTAGSSLDKATRARFGIQPQATRR